MGQSWDFGFYSEQDGKLLECFKSGSASQFERLAVISASGEAS